MVGRVGAPHGVRGWSQLWSFTDPPEGLLRHPRLEAQRGGQRLMLDIADSRLQGERVLVRFAGADDRDAAAKLTGFELSVPRATLEPPPPGSWYWHDLIGLAVVTVDGTPLGQVDHLIETGVNDVLVVRGERERLIPFAQPQIVKKVDLDAGRIEVDWDAEY